MDKSILITIDSILDTRWEMLKYLNYKITMEDYLSRMGDNFKGLGYTFRDLYRRRDIRLLRKVEYTPIHEIVDILTVELNREITEEESGGSIQIDVSFYPYIINDDNVLKFEHIFKKYFNNVNVKLIPDAINRDLLIKYDRIIDYNGLEVLNNIMMSKQFLIGSPIKGTLIVPDSIWDNNLFKKEKDREIFLQDMMNAYSVLIDIQIIDKKMFSIYR